MIFVIRLLRMTSWYHARLRNLRSELRLLLELLEISNTRGRLFSKMKEGNSFDNNKLEQKETKISCTFSFSSSWNSEQTTEKKKLEEGCERRSTKGSFWSSQEREGRREFSNFYFFRELFIGFPLRKIYQNIIILNQFQERWSSRRTNYNQLVWNYLLLPTSNWRLEPSTKIITKQSKEHL